MAREIEQIEKSLSDMHGVARALVTVFTALLVVLCAFVFYVLFRISQGISQIDASGLIYLKSGGEVNIIPSLLLLGITAVAIYVMRGISADVVRERSPFTLMHARKIKFLSVLFFIHAFLPLLINKGVFEISLLSTTLYFDPNSLGIRIGSTGSYIDLGALLAAIVCFALASFWRYGALLQQQSEGLV